MKASQLVRDKVVKNGEILRVRQINMNLSNNSDIVEGNITGVHSLYTREQQRLGLRT